MIAISGAAGMVALLTLFRNRTSDRDYFIAGMALIAWLPLPPLILVNHFRWNDYSIRYFTLPVFFGCLIVFTLPFAQTYLSSAVKFLCAIGLIIYLVRALPVPSANPDYARLAKIAKQLSEKRPGSVLLNGYWGAYVFAGLAAPGSVVPLPADTEYNRMPWNVDTLHNACMIWVGNQGGLNHPAGRSPPQRIFQYGETFEVAQPLLYVEGETSFSLYRKVKKGCEESSKSGD